jgi:hypothetical protein
MKSWKPTELNLSLGKTGVAKLSKSGVTVGVNAV